LELDKYFFMAGGLIDSTAFGEITVAGKPYDTDLTVYWDGRVSFRSKDHMLEVGELLKVMKAMPEVLVVGVGQTGGLRVAPEVPQLVGDRRIAFYCEVTPKAVEMFNAFVGSGKKAVGIFHVTC